MASKHHLFCLGMIVINIAYTSSILDSQNTHSKMEVSMKQANEFLAKAKAFIDSLTLAVTTISDNIKKVGMRLEILSKEFARWLEFYALLWRDIIQNTFDDNEFIRKERIAAGQFGLKMDRRQKIKIIAPGGQECEVIPKSGAI